MTFTGPSGTIPPASNMPTTAGVQTEAGDPVRAWQQAQRTESLAAQSPAEAELAWWRQVQR